MAIGISDSAVVNTRKLLEKRGTPNSAIRLGVRGGGCSGLLYFLEYTDDAPRPTDKIFEKDGLKVYIDPKSILYLDGSELDYVNTVLESGYKFRNPNEKSNCGCGVSFSV